MSGQRYKDQKQEEAPLGLDFEIPDVSQALESLDKTLNRREEIAKEHQDLSEKEEEEVKKGKRKPRQKPKGSEVCFCGNPFCRIGPFVKTQGEE